MYKYNYPGYIVKPTYSTDPYPARFDSSLEKAQYVFITLYYQFSRLSDAKGNSVGSLIPKEN